MNLLSKFLAAALISWAFFVPGKSIASAFPRQACEDFLLNEALRLGNLEKDLGWALWAKANENAMAEHLKENPEKYAEYIRKESHYRMLHELGLRSSPDGTAPITVQAFLSWYYRSMRWAMVKHGLTVNDILMPVTPFTNGSTQKIHFLKIGEPIPEGWRPHEGLLNDEVFVKAVADGFFPISGAGLRISNGDSTAFEHDIAHLTGFIEHPNYMRALRRAFQGFIRNKLYNQQRMFFMTEYFTLFKPRLYPELFKRFRLPKERYGEIFKVRDVEDHMFKEFAPSEAYPLAKDALTFYELNVQHFGGVSRDAVTRDAQLTNRNDAGYGQNVHFFYLTLKKEYEEHKLGSDSFAKLITAMLNFSRISPETYIAESSSVKKRLGKSSLLYRMIVESGLWTRGSIYTNYK